MRTSSPNVLMNQADHDEDRVLVSDKDLAYMEIDVITGDDSIDLKSPFRPFIPCSRSPTVRMEQEKRLRREIANSNERRRMQSINVGFQSLKSLLPKRDGEKISKASILQQSVQHIRRLQSEKTQLMQQIYQYKQLLEQLTASPNHPSVPGKLPAASVGPAVGATPIHLDHQPRHKMALSPAFPAPIPSAPLDAQVPLTVSTPTASSCLVSSSISGCGAPVEPSSSAELPFIPKVSPVSPTHSSSAGDSVAIGLTPGSATGADVPTSITSASIQSSAQSTTVPSVDCPPTVPTPPVIVSKPTSCPPSSSSCIGAASLQQYSCDSTSSSSSSSCRSSTSSDGGFSPRHSPDHKVLAPPKKRRKFDCFGQESDEGIGMTSSDNDTDPCSTIIARKPSRIDDSPSSKLSPASTEERIADELSLAVDRLNQYKPQNCPTSLSPVPPSSRSLMTPSYQYRQTPLAGPPSSNGPLDPPPHLKYSHAAAAAIQAAAAAKAAVAATVTTSGSFGGPSMNDGKGLVELEMMKREMLEMRLALDRERRSRVVLEDHVLRNMEFARLQSQINIPTSMALECAKSGILNYNFPSSPLPQQSAIPPSSVVSKAAAAAALMATSGASPACRYSHELSSSSSMGITAIPQEQLLRPLQPPMPHHRRSSLPSTGGNALSGTDSPIIPSLIRPQPIRCSSPLQAANHPGVGLSSTKQNLEVIVEAIRHLEGDQLFVDMDDKSDAGGGMAANALLRRMSLPLSGPPGAAMSRGCPIPLVSIPHQFSRGNHRVDAGTESMGR